MTAWIQLGRRILLALALVGLMSAVLAAPTGRKIGEFNFYDSEIPMVLKALSDVGGINIVVAPEVKGRITVTLKDVTAESALAIITKQANLAYEIEDDAYVVHEQRQAALGATPDYLILTVKGGGLTEIKNAIALAFKDVAAQELNNKRLVLTGDKDRLKLAKAFVDSLDTPGVDAGGAGGVETEESLYTVKTLVPWQAKRYLEDQYSADGLQVIFAPNKNYQQGNALAPSAASGGAPKATGGGTGDEGVAGFKVAAAPLSQDWSSDELILRGPKLVVDKALVTLTKLDMDVPLVEQRCSVKRIFSTQAIAYLLERYEVRGLTIYTAPMTFTQVASKNVEKGGTATSTTKSGQIGALVHRDKTGVLDVVEPLGDFIVRGPADVVKDAVAALAIVDVGPERVEHIYSVRYIGVEDAKKRLDDLYNAEGLVVTVAPTRRSNTPAQVDSKIAAGTAPTTATATADYSDVFDLILSGPDAVVTRAEALLTRLDNEPAQISVGTEILSITDNALTNLGVEWGSLSSAGILQPGAMSVGMNETQSGDPLKLGMIIRNPINLNATINMLASQNKVKVLNRPTTVVENGRQALIHVGEIVTYESLNGYTSTGPAYSTNTLSTGVTVQVKPLQSKDGVITLEISTNVTDEPIFRTSSSGSELPSYRENANTTVVKVHDGETLVIGGLRQTSESVSRDEVPVLGRIPLIGNLFRSKKTTPSQSELLILVTPKVLKSGAVVQTTGPAGN